MLEVKVLRRVHAPRNLSQPVEVVARNVKLARGGLEVLELVDLLVKDLAHGLGHVERLGLLLELVDELVLAIALDPELLLDPLELLRQVVLALPLLDLALDLLRQLALQLGVHQLLLEDEEALLQAILEVDALEDVLKLVDLARRDGCGKVGELLGLLEDVARRLGHGEVGDLVAEEGVELGDVLEGRDDLAGNGADELGLLVVRLEVDVLDVNDRDRVVLEERSLRGRVLGGGRSLWGRRRDLDGGAVGRSFGGRGRLVRRDLGRRGLLLCRCQLCLGDRLRRRRGFAFGDGEEVGDADSSVGVEDGGEARFLVLIGCGGREGGGDLGEDSDGVDRVGIGDAANRARSTLVPPCAPSIKTKRTCRYPRSHP